MGEVIRICECVNESYLSAYLWDISQTQLLIRSNLNDSLISILVFPFLFSVFSCFEIQTGMAAAQTFDRRFQTPYTTTIHRDKTFLRFSTVIRISILLFSSYFNPNPVPVPPPKILPHTPSPSTPGPVPSFGISGRGDHVLLRG